MATGRRRQDTHTHTNSRDDGVGVAEERQPRPNNLIDPTRRTRPFVSPYTIDTNSVTSFPFASSALAAVRTPPAARRSISSILR